MSNRSLASKFLNGIANLKFTPFTYTKKIHSDSNYLSFGQNYFDIQIKHVSRPCLIVSPGQEINATVNVKEGGVFRHGIGLLENLDPSVLNGALVINITIDGKPRESFNYKLFLNPSTKRTYESYYEYGSSWVDCFINLKEYVGQTLDLRIQVSFENGGKTVPVFSNSCVALASPQIVTKRKKSKAKRIIILLCEALSDPVFLQEYHKTEVEMPHYNKLLADSVSLKKSYSQNDSTMSSVGTVLTGLYGSQHGIKDYRSRPEYYETPVLSNSIKTIPQILKEKGFLTIGGGAGARLHSSYGWSRGFDYYYNAPTAWSDNVPDSAWAKRALETMEGNDGLLFMYLDRLHCPTITFPHFRSPSCYSIDELKDASSSEITISHYMKCLSRLDKQIGEIVSYLKEQGEYDNSLLIITGDHGSYLPPWGYHEKYAFYERHIRAPFVSKLPSWDVARDNGISENFGSASLEVSRTIMRTLGIEFPEYFRSLPQNSAKLGEYAITETLMHPTTDAYAISMVSENYKYVMFAKIDWNSLTFNGIDGERLYPVHRDTGHVDESTNLMDDINLKSKIKSVNNKYRSVALQFIETNLEFQKRHLTTHSKTGNAGWQPR